MNTTSQEPESDLVADRPRAATATAPLADEPVVAGLSGVATSPAASLPAASLPAASLPAAIAPAVSAASSTRVVPALSADAELAMPAVGEAPRTTCTQAQLRRFIKSRPWIPMHELRRRFGIFGGDDDVTPVRVASGTIFVGLPGAEGRMLGELLSSGDVGYELSLDPGAPIVVGVYPMRPVPRG
jgi:hypothetical protein